MNHAKYLSGVYVKQLRNILIPMICTQLRKHKNQFDSIVASGNSMMGIAPIIATKLDKQLITIRKPHEISHSTVRVEHYQYPHKYIVIDDFISSGQTMNYVINQMSEYTNGQLYGIYLYRSYCDALLKKLPTYAKQDYIFYESHFIKSKYNCLALYKPPSKSMYELHQKLVADVYLA